VGDKTCLRSRRAATEARCGRAWEARLAWRCTLNKPLKHSKVFSVFHKLTAANMMFMTVVDGVVLDKHFDNLYSNLLNWVW